METDKAVEVRDVLLDDLIMFLWKRLPPAHRLRLWETLNPGFVVENWYERSEDGGE